MLPNSPPLPHSPRRRPSTRLNTDTPQPKIIARACRICKSRKTRCDTQKPRCGACVSHNRECVYSLEPPKRRPTTSQLNALQEEVSSLERCIIALKLASPEDRNQALESIVLRDGKVHLPPSLQTPDVPAATSDSRSIRPVSALAKSNDDGREVSSLDEDIDPSSFLSLDECGQVGVYGPTSALHNSSPLKYVNSMDSEPAEPLRNQLIANAVLQRQQEYNLSRLPTIGGESSDLAMHLLDLHWNRQHHTFLLTYRPAIMRDLTGGPFCSDFLLNAIFACVSKFSERLEVRDSLEKPETAGRRFFDRCEMMISRDSLLSTSSIPTLVGLLLLGSTFNARGMASKGWLYTGYALRMVFDLGLHLDCKEVGGNAEEVEIRRRVFWGAFICDKLQSLYLGRSITIQLRDAHVSRDFMDTMEENELWTPYLDPKNSAATSTFGLPQPIPTPVYSVSTFQQLCLLSKIMTKIINRFYVMGATANNTLSHLHAVDETLQAWYKNLPSHLTFEPWSREPAINGPTMVAPNVIILLTTFNALVILLHRPFIFDGHLRPTTIPTASWKRCTTAARNITSLVSAYQSAYSLRRAPYLLSYAVYVACTIHVRSTAASTENGRNEENTSALIVSIKCLDELTVPNSGVSNPSGIIRRLMSANGIPNVTDNMWDAQTPTSQEWEALIRMFPPNSPNFTEYAQTQSLTGFGPQAYSSLNGLIDMYMPALNAEFLNPHESMDSC